MDSIRYYVALLLVLFAPGLWVFWFSIHPFIRFWRKLGPRWTLLLNYGFIAALAAAVFPFRKALLSADYGSNWSLIVLAVPIWLLGVALRLRLSRDVSARVLQGLPELAPEQYPTALITSGIYARIRHPRYLQMLIVLLAYALLANYLATYVMFLVSVVWVYFLVRVEERELRDRFGAAYEAYCAKVPRFLPW